MEMLSVRNKINYVDGIKVPVRFRRIKNMAELKQVLKCFYEKEHFPQVGLSSMWQGKAPCMQRQKDTLVSHPASHSSTIAWPVVGISQSPCDACVLIAWAIFCNIPRILSPFQRAKGTWSFHLTHKTSPVNLLK